MTNQILNPNDQMNDRAKERWDEFVISSPGGSFLQSWAWGEMQEKLGVAYWRLAQEEAGELKAVALVLRRETALGKNWLYVPRGPIWENPKLVDRVVKLAREQHSLFVRIEPLQSMKGGGWLKADHDVQPRHTLVLDLAEEEKMLAGMHHKTRYNIRLAERKGVTVRFSKEHKDVEEFLKLSKDVTERRGFHFHPDDYYRVMLEVLGGPPSLKLRGAASAELAVAEHGGAVLGVYFLIKYGATVTYVHGATSSARREVMAPHLLMWESIKRARSQGVRRFDFFGVAPPSAKATGGTDASHPWAGITRFKEGFGGRRENYAGAYDYVLSKPGYWLYRMARKLKR